MSDTQKLYAWAVDERTRAELTPSDIERDAGNEMAVTFELLAEDYKAWNLRDDAEYDEWYAVREFDTGRELEIRPADCGAACKCAMEVRLP